MDEGKTLFRLLRNDENPLQFGIIAKIPLAVESPRNHISEGSKLPSQWISTSRNMAAIDLLIKLKRKTEGPNAKCRVAVIDEQKLLWYSQLSVFQIRQLFQTFNIRNGQIPAHLYPMLCPTISLTTGPVLDFTDQQVLDTYIPTVQGVGNNNKIRGYAMKYSEVLVERYIPADCCIAVYNK
ncbi:uncharacterized protein LOC132736673 [Ruditapes philippinarum]|uniref:uncharacterized protein LOC132736673 n=1 Tax=Ruditapes philippinarum TaxID=129788 RepID=UPI00295B0520|nr:uncharacterized protein LOC132736673 [Ruditapes philippinarum]